MASHLRSVKATDKTAAPPERKKHSVTSAAKDGDRLDLLTAMRDRIASAVEDPETPARDLAALSRRLLEIAKDIDVLKAAAAKAQADERAQVDERFDASAI